MDDLAWRLEVVGDDINDELRRNDKRVAWDVSGDDFEAACWRAVNLWDDQGRRPTAEQIAKLAADLPPYYPDPKQVKAWTK